MIKKEAQALPNHLRWKKIANLKLFKEQTKMIFNKI